jgi:hypothetical protein
MDTCWLVHLHKILPLKQFSYCALGCLPQFLLLHVIYKNKINIFFNFWKYALFEKVYFVYFSSLTYYEIILSGTSK